MTDESEPTITYEVEEPLYTVNCSKCGVIGEHLVRDHVYVLKNTHKCDEFTHLKKRNLFEK